MGITVARELEWQEGGKTEAAAETKIGIKEMEILVGTYPKEKENRVQMMTKTGLDDHGITLNTAIRSGESASQPEQELIF